jgi:DNA-binding NtrC family response regulator
MRIVLIDDDTDVEEVIAAMLKSAGYEVCIAGDGEEGLALVAQGGADLVLTDILMPGTDGIQVITQLRANQPDLPVIAMSGGGKVVQYDSLPVASLLGAVQTLNKPFKKSRLLESVDAALNAVD